MVHEKSFPHVQYLAYALALLLQRSHIVIKETLKLLFGEHGINNLKNHGAVVLVQLINPAWLRVPLGRDCLFKCHT
jgi:hypothetical protein